MLGRSGQRGQLGWVETGSGADLPLDLSPSKVEATAQRLLQDPR